MKKSIGLCLIVLLLSCSEKKQEIDRGQFENELYPQLLPQLLDSIHLSELPPPANDSVDKSYQDKEFTVYLDRFTKLLTKEEQISFAKQYPHLEFEVDSSYLNKEGGIISLKNPNPKKLVFALQSKKYRLKYTSQNNSDRITDMFYCGKISLSDIKTDTSGVYAVFSVSHYCCRPEGNCGQGYTVFIKKTGRFWKIEKIVPTWVT
ncbi:hypothetical protein [Flavobacterium silvaticum]|uniref:Lipoprotein n=1 Tax=Flavobacterium silvaticum TaxID=1852020 RepID=A0A972FY47_9FLAO|nr:hypothetical protein [Flavobacterium silvaticum]NMH26976.1 hypothetical protein [Flavobacterium silvaticum]